MKKILLFISIFSLLLLSGCFKGDDEEQVWFDELVESLTLPLESNEVRYGFILPTSKNGATIEWSSNSTNLEITVKDNQTHAVIVRDELVDVSVKLTAKITYKTFSDTKSFELTVLKEGILGENMRKLILYVTIPEPLKDGEWISIGSNINGWNPGNEEYKATKVLDNKYMLELVFDITQGLIKVEYKWTIQDSQTASSVWLRVEKAEDGTSEIENRTLQVTGSNEDVVTIDNVVLAFADPSYVQPSTVVGNLDIIENFDMPQLNRTRTIRVWTPENYDPSNLEKRYPVIYAHDAQNLFDTKTSFAGEWQMDESIEKLIADLDIDGFIVVGIDNSAYRMDEYTPTWLDKPDSDGKNYARFIVETLKPYIDENYNTLPQRESTAVAGSSMGGLISFYIGLEYPEVFGMVGAFSPSFQINTLEARNDFINNLDYETNTFPKLYIDAGTNESLHTYVPIVANELFESGYDAKDIYTLVVEGDSHNEAAWRRRFPEALLWLSGDEDGNYVEPIISLNVELEVSQNVLTYIDTLDADGNFYFYTGSLAGSVALELHDNLFKGSLLVKPNDTINYQIIYYKEGVITLFGTTDGQKIEPVEVLISNQDVLLNLKLNEVETKEKVIINVEVPNNTLSYFNSFNSESAKLYLYTGSLANSYILENIDENNYQVTFFTNSNTSISFRTLFYSANDKITVYENNIDGSDNIGSTYEINADGTTTINHIVAGWQIPVLLTVNVSAPVIEIPEGSTLAMGLYQSIFGGSFRDSPMTTITPQTFTFEKQTMTQKVTLTAGYVLYPEGSTAPNVQKFERDSNNQVIITTYEVYVPFSQWDINEIATFEINHVIQDEHINY